MKKLNIILLIIVLILQTSPAMADNGANYMSNTVFVFGQIPLETALECDTVTMILYSGPENGRQTPDGIVHLAELKTDGAGRYEYTFELDAGIAPQTCSLKLCAGNMDVTDSLLSAGYFTDMVTAHAVKADDGKGVEIGVNLSNMYRLQNAGCFLLAAAYDTADTLLCTQTMAVDTLPVDESLMAYFRLEGEHIEKLSLFVWDNQNTLQPLGKAFVLSEGTMPQPAVYTRIEAETYHTAKSYNVQAEHFGVGTENQDISNAYICYEGIELTNVSSLQALITSNRKDEALKIRIDHPQTGKVIGKIPLYDNGVQATGESVSYTISLAAIVQTQGVHDLYICADEDNTGSFVLEHFILSSETLPEAGEDLQPYYVNNDSAQIRYSSQWTTTAAETQNYQEDIAAAAADGAYAEYTFFGTGIDYLANLTPDGGKVRILIDGTEEAVIDCANSSGTVARTVFTKTGLSKWWHTIRLERVEGSISLDAFKVYRRPIIVVCVGDSITDGVCWNKHMYSYPAQLQKRLGTGYYVVDCGHNGSTTAAYLGYGEGKTAVQLDADIYINALNTNDKLPNGATPEAEHTFKSNYAALMQVLENASAVKPRLYCAIPPCGQASRFEGNQAVKEQWLQELAQENNWPVIDFDYWMEPYRVDDITNPGIALRTEVYQDACHPNEKGYSFMSATAKASLPCPELLDGQALQQEISRLYQLTTDELTQELVNLNGKDD